MILFSKISDVLIFKRFLSSVRDSDIIVHNGTLDDLSNTSGISEYKSPKFWELYKSMPSQIDPSLTSILLFPGQGSQFVGMGKNLVEHPGAKNLFDVASKYLNFDILKLCLNGPIEKLSKTIYCQPAIYTVSLASLQLLNDRHPELIENCVATAGNSLGEISALVFAGVLSFEQGLHFIRIRAENMQKLCDVTRSGLLTVFLGPQSQLSKAMYAAKLYCQEKLSIENPVCEVSTYLFSECKIIGGNIEALEFIETFSKDFNLKGTKRLNVSGAFHTSLMRGATSPCRNALSRIGKIRAAYIPVLSNVTGTVHTSEAAIRRLLAQQVCRPVLWEQSLMRLYLRPEGVAYSKTVEIGPGTQLGATVKRVNAKALSNYMNFDV